MKVETLVLFINTGEWGVRFTVRITCHSEVKEHNSQLSFSSVHLTL